MSTIVITGASSGIGAESARALGELGWDIAVVGRNPARTKAVAAEVGGRPYLTFASSSGGCPLCLKT